MNELRPVPKEWAKLNFKDVLRHLLAQSTNEYRARIYGEAMGILSSFEMAGYLTLEETEAMRSELYATHVNVMDKCIKAGETIDPVDYRQAVAKAARGV
jgi:hypothetical protein